jgi:hypothetical protein
MAIRIKSKNSVVKDKAPLPTDLEVGELALNAHQDSPAIYLKDAAGAVRKIAGAGSVGMDWSRTGTELSPKTAGDSVFTTGAVKVGGTTAAPKIKLSADGSASFNDSVFIGNAFASAPTNSFLSLSNRGTASNNNIAASIYASESPGAPFPSDSALSFACKKWNGSTYAYPEYARINHAGDFLLGGTLPASPNITLTASGTATFAGGGGVGDGSIANVINTVDPEAQTRQVGLNSSRLKLRTFTGYGADPTKVTEVQFLDRNNASINDRLRGRIGAYNDNGSTTTGAYVQLIGGTGTDANAVKVYESGVATFTQDVKIGGTLPASPNITLKADGNINAKGAVARVYADNTAAKAGGLVDGDIYRTATGQLMIVFT